MSTTGLRALLLLGSAALAGCGQEGAAPGTAAREAAVTGSVTKGPLQGATVSFFRIDAVTGSPTTFVTSAVTDASGNFVVTSLPAGELILAKTSGGSYVDESDPDTSASRRQITFGAGEFLEALLPAGATSIAITPYSMALYKKALVQANGGNFANVYAAVMVQAEAAFGFDPILTLPANPITGAGGDAQYAILLGAAAQAINAIAVSAGHLPG